MDPELVKKILRALGLSAGFIIGAMAIGGIAWLYINYLESKKLKLEIMQLENELGIANSDTVMKKVK